MNLSVSRRWLPYLAFGLVLYLALAALIASNPAGALGYWPGALVGGLGCVVWHACRRRPPSPERVRRGLKITGGLLGISFLFALVPQRDIPIGLPFGILAALTIALVLDRQRSH